MDGGQEKISRRMVTLVYNGTKEVEADRDNVAASGHYFDCLLSGPFKESIQDRVELFVDADYVSFECFKKMIDFASSGKFAIESRKNYHIYFPMIQQAALWEMSKLIEVIQIQLPRYIDEETIVDIHTLAARKGYQGLLEKCLEFEKRHDILGTPERTVTRCIFPDHPQHHYRNCWCHNFCRLPLSDAKTEQLAEDREFNNTFVETSRFKRRLR